MNLSDGDVLNIKSSSHSRLSFWSPYYYFRRQFLTNRHNPRVAEILISRVIIFYCIIFYFVGLVSGKRVGTVGTSSHLFKFRKANVSEVQPTLKRPRNKILKLDIYLHLLVTQILQLDHPLTND